MLTCADEELNPTNRGFVFSASYKVPTKSSSKSYPGAGAGAGATSASDPTVNFMLNVTLPAARLALGFLVAILAVLCISPETNPIKGPGQGPGLIDSTDAHTSAVATAGACRTDESSTLLTTSPSIPFPWVLYWGMQTVFILVAIALKSSSFRLDTVGSDQVEALTDPS
jgi:hypothetical protein